MVDWSVRKFMIELQLENNGPAGFSDDWMKQDALKQSRTWFASEDPDLVFLSPWSSK